MAFKSDAINLPGERRARDVYLWDPEHGVILPTDFDEEPHGYDYDPEQDFTYSSPQINNSGQVLFEAALESGWHNDIPNVYQVFIWDPEKGLTLVSSPDGVTGGDSNSLYSRINNAGQVVFKSVASNLPGANGHPQIYLWERNDNS